jgi:hypothetical protein
MSDPVIDKLTRFTPTDRLDRDELLFRAGRASAPGRQVWIVLVGILAASQVTTIALWYTQPRPVEIVPEVPIPADAPSPPRFVPDSYGSLRATWDGDRLPDTLNDLVRSEPLTLRTVWSDPALK